MSSSLYRAMPIAAGAAKAAIESILAFSAPNLKSRGITRLPKKIPMTMPIPATARSVIHSSGELIWKLLNTTPPAIPSTKPVTAPKTENIIKVRNFAVTRSFLVMGITNAYFSHLEILSKEKVVIIIILHSRQQVT